MIMCEGEACQINNSCDHAWPDPSLVTADTIKIKTMMMFMMTVMKMTMKMMMMLMLMLMAMEMKMTIALGKTPPQKR